jgi:predicted dehydrogenase
MRFVLIGTSHWHTPFYSDPVLGMKDATIVGVSDPDAGRAAPLAAQVNAPSLPTTGRCARR